MAGKNTSMRGKSGMQVGEEGKNAQRRNRLGLGKLLGESTTGGAFAVQDFAKVAREGEKQKQLKKSVGKGDR